MNILQSENNPSVGRALFYGRRLLSSVVLAVLLVASMSGCSVEARKARYLAAAEKYFNAGDYEKAKIEYMNLLLVDPRNELPFQRLGFIWAEEGVPLRAVPFLMKARELAPNDLANRLTLARTLMSLSRADEARKELIAILDQSPEHDEAIVLLADSDQTKEDLDYTDQYLRKVSSPEKLSVQLALGNVAVQKGDFASAANSLQRAAALDVNSPLPHLALANLYIYQKKLAEAEQELKTATELAPLRSGARLRYAEFKMSNGGGDQAKDLLEDTVHQVPDYLPAWCLLSQIALQKKRYDESLKLLENVFSRDPKNPEGRILEADTFLAKGETKTAVERFEELEKTYKDVPIINYELARAYLQNNNPGQASVALTHAIAAKPDYVDAILLRAELDLRGGNASLVVPGMTAILKRRPHQREAELLLTEAYLSLNQFEAAAAVIRNQIHFSPEDADAHYRLGLVLHEQKKFNEAKAAFENVVKLVPNNLKAINQLVDLDIETKDFAAAMSRVQGELQKHPESSIGYFMEGKVHAAQQRLDLAEASLNKALELDSNSLGTYQLLIVTYLNDQKPDLAIKQLQSLLSADPHQTWALSTLAATYAKTGDLEKARDTYEKLLSETPNAADVMTKLALLYADRFNQLNKAYDLASKARTLAPVDPVVADTLGWISYKQANFQQAIDLIREAADKLPDNPEVQAHLGMARYMMDQPDEARLAFKKALAAKTDFPHKDEAARWLAMLEDNSGGTKQFSVAELEALVQSRPKDVVARSRLASRYTSVGAFEKAAAQYETALSINPNLANAALELAQLYSGPLRNLNRALEMAKIARDLNKSDPQTDRILGKIAYQTRNFSWAYDLLSEANRGQKKDPEIAYDLAWAAYSLGKIPEALQRMRHALELGLQSPHSDDAHRFVDLVTIEQNDKKSAVSEADIQKLLNPSQPYVPALMVKAAILMERADSTAATDTYNEILQQFPDFAPAEKQLARLYLDTRGSLNRGYELAVKARNSMPDDAEVAETLGELSYSRKDYAYALQLLQESGRRKPLDARGLYYLGMSYLATQNENESYQALARSLSAGLREPLASEAKRVLADLEQKRRKNS